MHGHFLFFDKRPTFNINCKGSWGFCNTVPNLGAQMLKLNYIVGRIREKKTFWWIIEWRDYDLFLCSISGHFYHDLLFTY